MDCVYISIAQLKETEGADSVTEIDQAADIILKLDPECYYSFYHDEDKALDDSLLVTTTESSSSASLPRTGGKIMECSYAHLSLMWIQKTKRREIKSMILKL